VLPKPHIWGNLETCLREVGSHKDREKRKG